jgi:hypothetical protein
LSLAWRIGSMMAVALAGFVLLQLPWALSWRRDRHSGGTLHSLLLKKMLLLWLSRS